MQARDLLLVLAALLLLAVGVAVVEAVFWLPRTQPFRSCGPMDKALGF